MENSQLQEVKDIFREKKLGRLFAGDTENTLIQFFRYLFVGGFATVVDWGVSYLLFKFLFHEQYPVAANSISFVAGLAVNYIISTFWIFKNSKVESRLLEFLGFAAIGAVGLIMTMGITRLFEAWFAARTSAFQILAKIVSTGMAFFWNFFARKILLFTKKEKPDEGSAEKYSIENSKENSKKSGARKVSFVASYIFTIVLFITVICITVYYITTGQKAEFHSDCTDTIMWANASYESGHIYDRDFGYACFLPFGVNLIMQPFLARFGLSLTTHIIGMTCFFVLLVLFFFLMLREMHWDIRYICVAGSFFLSMTLVSAKVRELFWGHTIYYTLGLLFLFIGIYLYGHLMNLGLRKETLCADGRPAQAYSIRYYVTFALLCIFIMFTATDGISGLTIFAFPFTAAVFAEAFINSKTPVFSRKIIIAGLRSALFLAMVFLGIKLNNSWLGGMTAGYQDGYSNYSSMSTWVEHVQKLPLAWLRLLGVVDMDGMRLAGSEGVKNLIYIFNALIIFVIPIIATTFYTRYDRDIKGCMIRVWVWVHWAGTAIILSGYICGVLSDADWRLLPIVGTSLILSLLFIMWAIEKRIGVSRLAAMLALPLLAVSFMSCIEVGKMPKDGYKSNYLFKLTDFLEDENLSYGYGTFWNANAITVISGSRVKVREVTVDDNGVAKRIYQSSQKWYEDQPGQEDYFLLLLPEEYDKVNQVAANLITDCTRELTDNIDGTEFHVLVFDHNIV